MTLEKINEIVELLLVRCQDFKWQTNEIFATVTRWRHRFKMLP